MSVAVVVPALLVAALVGARLLRGAAWTRRRPVTGIVAWQLLQGAGLLGLLWVPVVAVAPEMKSGATLQEFVAGCLHGLLAATSSPGQRIALALALLWSLLGTGRVLVVLVTSSTRARRERRAVRLAVVLIGSQHDHGVRVVPGTAVGAYCVPGRRPLVVITSAAREDLSDPELAAVLAHERAHLRWRHDLVLLGSQTLARAFPFVGMFLSADRECRTLVEMAADDQAARVTGGGPVATALLRSATSSAPPAALSMARTSVHERVERLAVGRREARRGARTVGGVVLAVPVLAGASVVVRGLADSAAVLRACGLL